MAESDFVAYHGTLAMNRKVFLLNHGDFVRAYDQIHAALERLPVELATKRDINGKTNVSLIPFMALMSRQTLLGFDHLASFQPYQAWMAVRPAVEIPLVIGKWLDDPKAAAVWLKRETDPKAYMKEYGGGKQMRSNSLKCSPEVQSVLKALNDQFVHPNPFYYHRHLELASIGNGKISLEINYFDEQDTIQPHVLAFLHLASFLHDGMRDMLASVLGSTHNTRAIVPGLQDRFGDRVRSIRASDPIGAKILRELGVWPEDPTEPPHATEP